MYKIIVIEDEKFLLDLLLLMLSPLKSDIYMFDKAQDALDLLEKNQGFDLIIADLTMPPNSMSGLDLLKAIRTNNKTKHIPILLQTGVTAEAELGAAMQFADSYIIKPYRKELFIEKILGCINQSRNTLNENI